MANLTQRRPSETKWRVSSWGTAVVRVPARMAHHHGLCKENLAKERLQQKLSQCQAHLTAAKAKQKDNEAR